MSVAFPNEQKVLDHGYVRVAEKMGTDETVIDAARMSTGRGFVSWAPYERCSVCGLTMGQNGRLDSGKQTCKPGEHDTTKYPRGDKGLLEYLYKNGHHTPFEMCHLHVEINAPIFVWRQIHRHRTFSYNEQSGRYGELQDAFYLPALERVIDSFRSSPNKQAKGSGKELTETEAQAVRAELASEQESAHRQYKRRLDLGMAPELARLNAPVSQYSKCRMSGNLRNWLHFLDLRLDSHAQWEIRRYASAVGAVVEAAWPLTYALFLEHTYRGVRLSSRERTLLSAGIDDMIEAIESSLSSREYSEVAAIRAKIRP